MTNQSLYPTFKSWKDDEDKTVMRVQNNIRDNVCFIEHVLKSYPVAFRLLIGVMLHLT